MHIPGNFTVTCSRHTSIRKSWGRGNHKYSFWGNEIITYLHNKVILARSVQHVKANPTLALISCLTFRRSRIYLKKQSPLLQLLHPTLPAVFWWISPCSFTLPGSHQPSALIVRLSRMSFCFILLRQSSCHQVFGSATPALLPAACLRPHKVTPTLTRPILSG